MYCTLQKGFEPTVKWDALGQQSPPSDKSFTPTGVTLIAAMVYGKTKVINPPSTWQQLLSAAYKGQAGMNDRPTGVQLCATHTGEHHVTGTVADVAFRGRATSTPSTFPGTGA